MSTTKDLAKAFLDYETTRAHEALLRDLRSMAEDIKYAILDLEAGREPSRPNGLANNLTDAFHRLGQITQLRNFASLREAELPKASAPCCSGCLERRDRLNGLLGWGCLIHGETTYEQPPRPRPVMVAIDNLRKTTRKKKT